MQRLFIVGALVASLFGAVSTVHAQTLTVLHSFTGTNPPVGAGADGATPFGALTLSGSTLYGTTKHGGGSLQAGTLFSVDVNTGVEQVLYSFGGTNNGELPVSSLILRGSTLYGTAPLFDRGKPWGELFSYDTGTRVKTTLTNFMNGQPNGYVPSPGVVANGSILYGTSENGPDPYSKGTIYSYNLATRQQTVLHIFSGKEGAPSSDGAVPRANMTLVGSKLYGTTYAGGTYGFGTVFVCDTQTNQVSIVYSFGTVGGSNPYGSLLLSGSKLYGTTSGGSQYTASLFSIDTGTGLFSRLCSLPGYASGNIAQIGDILYGTTQRSGSSGDGSVYSYDTKTGAFAIVFSFNGLNGSQPIGGLITDGTTLYGTTVTGGPNGNGEVFALKP
ncbi:MAG: hypothetical protein H8F28_13765 [Fibrella sp.]|nr:hypothetical protein [Armatimonadota bacterium]